MLEFLFDFIERNIVLVFICVLLLGIASAYSKGIKFLFLSILGTAMCYFALLCFYRLGYGIESLYNWSSEIVIRICYYIDYYNLFCFSHSFVFTKVMEYFLHQGSSNTVICLVNIIATFAFIVVAFGIVIPRIKLMYSNKMQINLKDINKITYKYNTINRVESKIILNSVFRC